MRFKKPTPSGWIVLGALIYLNVAMFAFALRHPEMTDTERFVRLLDALLWR